MKVSILIAIVLLSQTSFYVPAEQSAKKKKKMLVIFNHQLTFDDLVEIKKQVAKNGGNLIYNKIQFDSTSKLVYLDFRVRFEKKYGCHYYDGGTLTDSSL